MKENCAPDPGSVLDGGRLPHAARPPSSLADVLTAAALSRTPGETVFVLRDRTEVRQSYPCLRREAERLCAGLHEAGLRAEDCVILQAEEPHLFLTSLWACVLAGVVVVVLPPSSAEARRRTAGQRLGPVWHLMGRPRVLSTRSLAPAIQRELAEFGGEAACLACVEELMQSTPDGQWKRPRGHDLALVIPTSGSTAAPKLVRLTHHNILSSLAGSVWVNRYSEAEVSLNWLPLYHVGGLLRSLREVYLGCRQIQIGTELIRRDPFSWFDYMHDYQATLSWAPNTVFGLLMERRRELATRRHWDLHRVRSLYTSGEPAVGRTMLAFRDMMAPYGLPADALHVAWGMTEACFATFSHTYLQDWGSDGAWLTHVGRPVPGVSIRIVDDDDKVVAPGIRGHVQVAGSVVSSGYIGDVGQSSFVEGHWLRTGDVGLIQENRLIITGREQDVLILGGANFSNCEIEAAVGNLRGTALRSVAACTVRATPDETETLAIFYSPAVDSPRDPLQLVHTIRAAVADVAGLTARFVIPLTSKETPTHGIGKVQRAHLRDAFAAGRFDAFRRWPFDLRADPAPLGLQGTTSDPDPACTRRIAVVIADVLGLSSLGPDDNFFAMGGTSLQVVQAVDRLRNVITGRPCTVIDLFRAATPRALAALLTQDDASQAVAVGLKTGLTRQARHASQRSRAQRRKRSHGQSVEQNREA